MSNLALEMKSGFQPKLTKWANEPTVAIVKEDLEQSKSFHDAHINKVKGWNDLSSVSGTAKPLKVKGRSSVQPKLIRRQAEWRYAALTEPFLGTEKLYKVSPVTFEDTRSAKQNETLLNWQFRTKLNKIKFIDDYVRSVVDEGTAIVRIGWKRTVVMVKKKIPVFTHYEITSEEEAQVFQQALIASQADNLNKKLRNLIKPERFRQDLLKLIKNQVKLKVLA